MLKRTLHAMILCAVSLFVLGCESAGTIDDPPIPANNPTPFPGFTFPLVDSANFTLPVPNNILLNGQTGLVDIPFDPATASAALQSTFNAVNSLDGFSTTGSIIIPFNGTIVESSVTPETLIIQNSITGATVPVSYTFTTTATGSVIIATPIVALEDGTRYTVVLTSGITSALSGSSILSDNTINLLKRTDPVIDGNGNSLISVLNDQEAQEAEVSRQRSQQGFRDGERITGVSRDNIPYSFSFTTQNLFRTLPQLRNQTIGDNPAMVNPLGGFPLATGNVSMAPPNPPSVQDFFAALPAPLNAVPVGNPSPIASIFLTQIEVATYRNDITTEFFANPPVQTGTRQVPALVFLPAAPVSTPPPAVIFQHGLGGNKFLAGILAPALTGQGFAVVAIDLEQHGALSAANTGGSTLLPFVITPDPLFGGDPLNDVSRTLNLTNLRNSRDNLRASVVNLYAVTNAIMDGRTNIDGVAGPDIAPVPPFYIGTSLGAIVGEVFHATEPNLGNSVMNAGGGRISALLLNSTNLAPGVIDGLAQAGITQDSPLFGLFFLAAQTVVDDADPINYARPGITGTLRGGTGMNTLQQLHVTDATVPPSAQYDMAIQHSQGTATPAFSQVDAVASADPFAQLLQAFAPQAASPFAGPGAFEVTGASHSAFLGADGPATAVALVTQAITFLGTGNIVGDPGLRTRAAFQQVEAAEANPFEGWDPFQLNR